MNEPPFFPEHSARFGAAIKRLEGRDVAVLGHMRPDGDCIGSMVAMVRMLNRAGARAVGVNRDVVPTNLQAFVGDTPVLQVDDFSPNGELAVSVDCADYKRVGQRLQGFYPDPVVNIDHHISNQDYAEENFVVSTASATAEILAGFFLDLGLDMDAVTAQALYVGIATDTGQFRFPSTTPATFEITRRLCEYGARPAEAAFELYERESFGKIKLLQHFLASLRIEFEGRVCVGLLRDGVYAECGASLEDAEGLVDYARSIDGVDVGVLIEDRSGSVKASLRSKNPIFRVDQVAKEFHGGGHACAAGLNVEDSSIDAFYPKLMEALGRHLEQLPSAT